MYVKAEEERHIKNKNKTEKGKYIACTGRTSRGIVLLWQVLQAGLRKVQPHLTD